MHSLIVSSHWSREWKPYTVRLIYSLNCPFVCKLLVNGFLRRFVSKPPSPPHWSYLSFKIIRDVPLLMVLTLFSNIQPPVNITTTKSAGDGEIAFWKLFSLVLFSSWIKLIPLINFPGSRRFIFHETTLCASYQISKVSPERRLYFLNSFDKLSGKFIDNSKTFPHSNCADAKVK